MVFRRTKYLRRWTYLCHSYDDLKTDLSFTASFQTLLSFTPLLLGRKDFDPTDAFLKYDFPFNLYNYHANIYDLLHAPEKYNKDCHKEAQLLGSNDKLYIIGISNWLAIETAQISVDLGSRELVRYDTNQQILNFNVITFVSSLALHKPYHYL